MNITETDSCYAREQGGARSVWPARGHFPWAYPSVKPVKRDASCIGPGNCWYAREGFTQCYDHADGACIIAQRARA